jgi:putative tricarboxylic transport membrane protein
MNRNGIVVLIVVALIGVVGLGPWSSALAWEPKGQGECIAPANPGGGWDAVCRSTSAALQKTGIYKETLYVTNMPGGSGAVAIANVITKRKGDTNLLVAASNALTFTMALNRTQHTYKDIIPIAQIGAEIGGFFVRPDSRFQTMADLANALKTDPKSVTFSGGSAPGGQDHVKAALFAKAIGIDPTKVVYVPFQGGGEALTSLLGGHTQVGAIDISEAAGQYEAGKIRCLGLLSEKRSSKFKEIPTSFEQGFKVSYPIWRGLYMAPGTPPDAVAYWSDAIRKMVATPEWQAEREKLGWEPTYRFGEEFNKFVNDELASFKDVLKELGFLK